PPTLIKFETPSESVLTGVKTYFTFTADSTVDEVRMFDDLGTEIIGQLSNADEDKKIWSLAVVFDQPFDSVLRAEVRRGETWYPSDKTLSLNVIAPTPTPPPLPQETAQPQPAVQPVPTDAPFVIPTDVPTAVATDAPAPQPVAAFVVPTPQSVPQAPVNTLAPLPVAEPVAEEPGAADDIIIYDDVQEDAPAADSQIGVEGATGAVLITQAPYVVLPSGDQQAGIPPEAVNPAASLMDEIPIFIDEMPGQVPAAPTADGVTEPAAAEPIAAEPVAADPATEVTTDAVSEGVTDIAAEPAQQPAEEPAAVAEVPAAPASSPMPVLTAAAAESADPAKLKITDTVYQNGKKVTELTRTAPVSMSSPAEYLSYEGGVFTFRGDSFRGNAAFGTADMPLKQLSVLWKAPLGSMRTSSGTLYGLGWTGQPAIVKWAKELRQMMNLNAVKKEVAVLKEVIAAGQDGKIYFFDLNDGVATRDPIDVGYPMKGSVAVDAAGQPMMAVGQGISQLPKKTGPIGLRVFDLITQKEMYLLNGRKSKTQAQYSTNGAFDGTPLFERNTGTLVVAGENGLLYTVALNTKFDYLDKHTIAVEPAITYLRSKTAKQADMSVTAEASVAMYAKYVYMADRQGILKCVDTDTMKTVWAFDTGDNTDATPALGFDADGSLGLYTGTTVFSRTRKAGNAMIRRVDALTGEEKWKVEVPAKYEQTERAGVKASPVVGQNSIQDLVIFTVNMTNDGKGATVLALNKQTGAEVWRYELSANAISSPVAVYTPSGDACLVQA
ncbi:MAG: PQQ-binding-like beta-propeller repeat protein, partial [Clostridiales bacterium]|nr:PQQ-binding-like beta-propeller repeat protein [Clostridiales bacterium]